MKFQASAKLPDVRQGSARQGQRIVPKLIVMEEMHVEEKESKKILDRQRLATLSKLRMSTTRDHMPVRVNATKLNSE